MSFVRLENLSCGYGRTVIVSGLTLDLEKGEALTIIGPNGCGKSTLMKTVSGLLRPLGGKVLVEGLAVNTMSLQSRSRTVSLLSQIQSLDTALTVEELVALGRTPYLGSLGGLAAADHKAVEQAILRCDLASLKHQQIGKISGGERQRARLAMTIAQETPLLLLDEPTNHMDVNHRYGLYTVLSELRQDRQVAVVMICHSVTDAVNFAPRTLLVSDGSAEAFSSSEHEQLRKRVVQINRVPPNWVY